MKRLLFDHQYMALKISLLVLLTSAMHVALSQSNTNTDETNYTLTYEESIREYEILDSLSPMALLTRMGSSDGGNSIYLFTINKDRVFNPDQFNRKKSILFVNNAIHAGEPDGVEASLQLARLLLDEKSDYHQWLDSVIVCIVPIYNTDGAMRRNNSTRVNQNGPSEYGFRASAKNLDLNRDFMKGDSKNTLAFCRAFSKIHPTVFLDTHVSNGSDYTYTMTLIATQADKLGTSGKYMTQRMLPALYQAMKQKGDEMIPYVDTYGATPETGVVGFMDTPRYASGYAAAHHAFALISETHMLKSFDRRVKSTLRLMQSLLQLMYENNAVLLYEQRQSEEATANASKLAIAYELDTTRVEKLNFKGYTAVYEPSLFGEGTRLRYNHDQPWEKEIPYFNHYKVTKEVDVPTAYIIPQAWSEVIERLRWNHVDMAPLLRDTVIEVGYEVCDGTLPNSKLYEGHYYHPNLSTTTQVDKVQFQRGDWVIKTNQKTRRFIVEALEPQAVDSYFRWNFFDAAMQQKEWFSDYVFEEIAADLLQKNPKLKEEFEAAMKNDEQLRKDHWQQLYWVYKRSPYYEGTAYRIPVYKVR